MAKAGVYKVRSGVVTVSGSRYRSGQVLPEGQDYSVLGDQVEFVDTVTKDNDSKKPVSVKTGTKHNRKKHQDAD